MKVRRVLVENVRSFLEPAELIIDGDILIIIGPNGGGKTNLLDTISIALRLFLLKSWLSRHNPTAEWQERYGWIANDSINANILEKHSKGRDKGQRIEIDIELTERDLLNINKAKEEANVLTEKAKGRYTSLPIEQASSWDTSSLSVGQVFRYTILNNKLQAQEDKAANVFQQYLNIFEIDSRIRSEMATTTLSTPMISLPVNRSAGGLQVSIALADFNEGDYKRSVDAASSRSAGSIVSLAIGRLARHYRYLLEADNGKAKETFYSDPQIKTFSETLKSLGYSWELECVNKDRNQYDIRLTKQGSSFLVGAASSGEKELLIYLFAIYALNIKDALIIIDEPELHLHPRWQKALLELFERLTTETGNQFLMATHSPVFVSPSSIQYVSRVYSESQQSKIVRLTDTALPDAKHLLNMVNSQNNERLFFADFVVLVEGISDRIFFEKLFLKYEVGKVAGQVYEIVNVGGKNMFEAYKKLLNACKIRFAIIADLDYVNQVGSAEIKKLFQVNSKDISEKVIDNQTSIDAQTLLSVMDAAIESSNLDDLKQLWEYIKSRQRKLRTDLTSEEATQLDAFIKSKWTEKIFILAKGALEAYLPNGYKSKDMEKLIQLVSDENILQVLPQDELSELKGIIDNIQK